MQHFQDIKKVVDNNSTSVLWIVLDTAEYFDFCIHNKVSYSKTITRKVQLSEANLAGADTGGAGPSHPPEISRQKKSSQYNKSYVYPFFKLFNYLMEL